MSEDVLKRGHLKKKGRSGGWKDRYFILTPAELKYYHQPSDFSKAASAKGSIPLNAVEKVKDYGTGKEFKVKTKQKSYYLTAKDADEKADWVAFLQRAVQLAKGNGAKAASQSQSKASVGESQRTAQQSLDPEKVRRDFGHQSFDSVSHVEKAFEKYSTEVMGAYSEQLLTEKLRTEGMLKKEVCEHYLCFMQGSEEIRKMETDMRELKRLLAGSEATIKSMQNFTLTLDPSAAQVDRPSGAASQSQEEVEVEMQIQLANDARWKAGGSDSESENEGESDYQWLCRLTERLEACLVEHDYSKATQLIVRFLQIGRDAKHARSTNGRAAVDSKYAAVDSKLASIVDTVEGLKERLEVQLIDELHARCNTRLELELLDTHKGLRSVASRSMSRLDPIVSRVQMLQQLGPAPALHSSRVLLQSWSNAAKQAMRSIQQQQQSSGSSNHRRGDSVSGASIEGSACGTGGASTVDSSTKLVAELSERVFARLRDGCEIYCGLFGPYNEQRSEGAVQGYEPSLLAALAVWCQKELAAYTKMVAKIVWRPAHARRENEDGVTKGGMGEEASKAIAEGDLRCLSPEWSLTAVFTGALQLEELDLSLVCSIARDRHQGGGRDDSHAQAKGAKVKESDGGEGRRAREGLPASSILGSLVLPEMEPVVEAYFSKVREEIERELRAYEQDHKQLEKSARKGRRRTAWEAQTLFVVGHSLRLEAPKEGIDDAKDTNATRRHGSKTKGGSKAVKVQLSRCAQSIYHGIDVLLQHLTKLAAPPTDVAAFDAVSVDSEDEPSEAVLQARAVEREGVLVREAIHTRVLKGLYPVVVKSAKQLVEFFVAKLTHAANSSNSGSGRGGVTKSSLSEEQSLTIVSDILHLASELLPRLCTALETRLFECPVRELRKLTQKLQPVHVAFREAWCASFSQQLLRGFGWSSTEYSRAAPPTLDEPVDGGRSVLAPSACVGPFLARLQSLRNLVSARMGVAHTHATAGLSSGAGGGSAVPEYMRCAVEVFFKFLVSKGGTKGESTTSTDYTWSMKKLLRPRTAEELEIQGEEKDGGEAKNGGEEKSSSGEGHESNTPIGRGGLHLMIADIRYLVASAQPFVSEKALEHAVAFERRLLKEHASAAGVEMGDALNDASWFEAALLRFQKRGA
jgi:hypothetical protein